MIALVGEALFLLELDLINAWKPENVFIVFLNLFNIVFARGVVLSFV